MRPGYGRAMSSRSTVVAFLVSLVCACSSAAQPSAQPPQPQQPQAQQSKYEPGQEYSFRARPQDPAPRFVVLQVEARPELGTIVHVAVSGVRIENPSAPAGYSERVGHSPITAVALDRSDVKLERVGVPLPDFAEGYRMWRDANGGVFTVTLSEYLDVLEAGMAGGQ